MRYVLAGVLGVLGLLLNAGCGGAAGDGAADATESSGGENGAEATNTSGDTQAPQSSGGTEGTGAAAGADMSDVATSSSGVIDVSFNDACELASVGPDCRPSENAPDLVCFSMEELNSPCAGTHLLSVHLGEVGEQPPVQGDGGTGLCPSAEELFWGDEGEKGGCFDTPACVTPTVESDSRCCYRAVRKCRLV